MASVLLQVCKSMTIRFYNIQNITIMKITKIILSIAAALIIAVPSQASAPAFAAAEASAQAGLNLSNGIKAGTALLALYKQYKADGKLDLTNANNISNVTTLVSNIKGLKSSDTSNTSFIDGLISGSKNLVTNSNSGSVISSLSSLAGLDVSSLGASAASSAVSGLLSKATSSSSSSKSSSAASTATSVLTSLFKSL